MLPQLFLDRMKQMLEEEYPAFLNSYEDTRYQALRINPSKTDTDRLIEETSFHLQPVPWEANGFYYEKEDQPGKHPYHEAGVYYIQEPSAMAPAAYLDAQPGEKVLDLCAAPGGKSTQIAAAMQGKGLLVSNEIHPARAKILSENMERMGVKNVMVTNESPQTLAGMFTEYFDRIMVDAPCSGEGMFRREEDMVKDWVSRGPSYYSSIQREILEQAVAMLKPGGMMLYSTCTFSKKEDEENVAYILEKYPSMELVPIDKEQFKGLSDGFGYPQTARLFPHRIQGEGHFLALFHKKEDENGSGSGAAVLRLSGDEKEASKRAKEAGKQEDLMKFLKNCRKEWDLGRIYIRDEQVYYLPEGLKTGLPLRFLRTGLHLGELKKGRFEPSQAFAMALKKDEYQVRLDLKTEDERVIRYLKGETISLVNEEEPVKGWCLVTVEGFPLGWAKGNGMTLKNKYYAGWRWQ